MGRPIKKKWFTAYEGSVAGNLTLAVGIAGTAEAIVKQTGTGVYDVASGRVKLSDPNDPAYVATDPASGVVGTATLDHDGRFVRRINQYRVTYFDDATPGTPEDSIWRDGDAQIVGTFTPALTPEGTGTPEVVTPPPVVLSVPEPEVQVQSEPKPKSRKLKSKMFKPSEDKSD